MGQTLSKISSVDLERSLDSKFQRTGWGVAARGEGSKQHRLCFGGPEEFKSSNSPWWREELVWNAPFISFQAQKPVCKNIQNINIYIFFWVLCNTSQALFILINVHFVSKLLSWRSLVELFQKLTNPVVPMMRALPWGGAPCPGLACKTLRKLTFAILNWNEFFYPPTAHRDVLRLNSHT